MAPAHPQFVLYNTLERRAEPVNPADPEAVTVYSCGPTVYDDAHIGNFRSFLAADVLRRWLESPLCTLTDDAGRAHAGPRQVTHVMNITDVGHMTDDSSADGGGEDKMELAARRLQESKKAGTAHATADIDPTDPKQIADFYTARFAADARALGLKVALQASDDPTLLPRATDAVPGMIAMIGKLIDRGHAYAVGETGAQTVYFDVQSFPDYGSLSGNTLERLKSGAGGRVESSHQAEKKHPADFLLWKTDPTHKMKWDSPWGSGYPGWHIECTAMSLERLAEPIGRHDIDIHTGGEDNIFPHHECEHAQSCGLTGHSTFARHWMHARFLQVEGEKMSKSTGNFFTARDLFAKGHSPAAVRFELIKTHYRANANFTEQSLTDAAKRLERWRTALRACDDANGPGDRADDARAEFAAAMADDLNVAGAIAAVDRLRSRIASGEIEAGSDTAQTLRDFDAVLGVVELGGGSGPTEMEVAVFADGVEPDAAIDARLIERRDAKKAKDFAKADAIRDELAGMGLAILDRPGGKVEVRRS
ncbi:MAG: cysteine--tRNA ligase [Planctomycetota bacterium]